MRRIVLPLLLAVAVCLGGGDPATAQLRQSPEPTGGGTGFRVCNKTSTRMEVAKALNVKANPNAPDDIISEGWYKLNPGDCTVLYSGQLQYRYYLVFAQEINGSRIWGGEVPVCVSHQRFTIRSSQCGSGYNRRMFHEVDTGDERNGWTHSFTN